MEKKLLIVDDEVTTLFAYKRLFETAGVGVETARTLEEGQAFLKDHPVEVIITDLRLSGKRPEGGFDILRFAKNCQPETKVILITAYGSSEVIKKAYELGASYYLEKPVQIKTLREVLLRLGIDTTAKHAMNGAPEGSE